jgi:hypothetical protein
VVRFVDVERLRSDAVWETYCSMRPDERVVLDGMIASLRREVRERSNGAATIGPRAGVEILAALGWTLNGVDPVTLEECP